MANQPSQAPQAPRTPEMPETPRRRADVTLRDLGDSAMLYDPVADQVIRLNATSRRIWDLCDGAHDVAALCAALERDFAAGPGVDLAADVRETVAAFVRAGLFE